MKTFLLTLLTFLTFWVSNLLAQNVSINSTGSNPDASAMLDVSSTTTGFLMPRMTTAQQNAIVLPAPGLTIFNTSLNTITINTGTSLSPVWSPLTAGAIDTSSIANFSTKVRSLLSSTAPITYSNGLIGITQATTSTNGYLSSTDWNTFNNKAGVGNTWSTSAGNTGTGKQIGINNNFGFGFVTNAIERMNLSAGGNLGIGTTPADTTNSEKLLVDGATSTYNIIGAKGNTNRFIQFNIKNYNSGNSASSDIVATNDVGTEANGINYIDMGINSSGYITGVSSILNGISNAYLYSTGNDFIVGNGTASKSLILFTGGTASSNEAMRIDGSGNIGINNSSPAQKLDVTGNIKFSGALMPNNLAGTSGYFLTSAGAGLAPTWIAPANQTISFAPTGDVTGSTTGTTTLAPALSIGALKVTNGMLAGSIDLTTKVTGQLPYANGGNTGTAATSATTGTMTVNMLTEIVTITPTGSCTFNGSGGLTGQLCTFVVTTSGSMNFTLTWNTNFKTTGTLSTSILTAKTFTISFICIGGSQWVETSRTAGM